MTRLGNIVWLVFVLCGACSVHWSLRPQETQVKRVYIPLPDNTSMKLGFDIEYYKALRQRIMSIKQLKLVESKSESDQVLLIDFKESELRRGPTSVTGDKDTSSEGGLADGTYTASSLILKVVVELESRSPKNGKVLWTRDFNKETQFEAANRFLEAEGASSLPIINESRVKILHKQLAVDFARMAVDQLIEEF